jgi:hypothetical protein
MKRSIFRRRALVFTIATAALLISSPSYAYLDPGTGSIILQGLIAGIAVAIGVARGYWQQFKLFLANLTGKADDKKNVEEPDLEQTSDVQSN